MILDTSGIDRDELVRFVDDLYDLDIVALDFQPKGEASYSYIATDRRGLRWVLKVQPMGRIALLEERLQAVRFIYDKVGFPQVVAPRQSRTGTYTTQFHDFTISLFPFLDGEGIDPSEQSDAYIEDVATLLGTFHRIGRDVPPSLPRETFDYPFEEQILHTLQTVEAHGNLARPMQERLRTLLIENRADILITLARIRQLQANVRSLELSWVLTHGDPNWSNMLIDRSNIFHLLDWDDVALGPPERDLVFLSDREPARFEAFLRQYLHTNPDVTLYAEVFGFYHYRWVVQEIADWSTRILLSNVELDEDEHAWAELQNYLPACHDAMERSIDEIDQLIRSITI